MPYPIGTSYASGLYFYGREKLLNDLLNETASNVLFVKGIRRIGKTSVLRRLEEMLLEKKHCPIFVDLSGADGSTGFAKLMSRGIRNYLSEHDVAHSDRTWTDQSFYQLLEEWADFCEQRQKVTYLLLDECERLHHLSPEEMNRVLFLLRNRSSTVKIVLAGTRKMLKFSPSREDLLRLLEQMKPFHIQHFPNDEAELIARQKQAAKPIEIQPDIFNQVYSESGGHGLFLQVVCNAHFDDATYSIKPYNLLDVPDSFLAFFFQDDYNSFTPAQRFYLRKLSNEGQFVHHDTLRLEWKGYPEPFDGLAELNQLGVVVCNTAENTCQINSQLFKRWLKENCYKTPIHVVYASEDTTYFQQFYKNLAVPIQSGQLNITHRGTISALDDTRASTETMMNKAHAWVFLLTPNLFADGHYNEYVKPLWDEMAEKQQLTQRIVPIWITSGIKDLIEGTAFEGKVALPDNNSSIEDAANQNLAWATTAKKLKDLLDQL